MREDEELKRILHNLCTLSVEEVKEAIEVVKADPDMSDDEKQCDIDLCNYVLTVRENVENALYQLALDLKDEIKKGV